MLGEEGRQPVIIKGEERSGEGSVTFEAVLELLQELLLLVTGLATCQSH